ncbi:MAG: hypothetical protein FWG87_11650 [Defluviitaleaceae bacterium]|nr:hypothetical protein [Defluviitaleaceae bacterium]
MKPTASKTKFFLSACLVLTAILSIVLINLFSATDMTLSVFEYNHTGDYALHFTIVNVPTSEKSVTIGIEKRERTPEAAMVGAFPLIVSEFYPANGVATGTLHVGALDDTFDYVFVAIAGKQRLEALLAYDFNARVQNIFGRGIGNYETIEEAVQSLEETVALAIELLEETIESEDGSDVLSSQYWATPQAIAELANSIASAQAMLHNYYLGLPRTHILPVGGHDTFYDSYHEITLNVSMLPIQYRVFEVLYDPQHLEAVDLADVILPNGGTVQITQPDEGQILLSYDGNVTDVFTAVLATVRFKDIAEVADITEVSVQIVE